MEIGGKSLSGVCGLVELCFYAGSIEGEGWMFRVSHVLHFSYPAFFIFCIFHILRFLRIPLGWGSWGAGRSEW